MMSRALRLDFVVEPCPDVRSPWTRRDHLVLAVAPIILEWTCEPEVMAVMAAVFRQRRRRRGERTGVVQRARRCCRGPSRRTHRSASELVRESLRRYIASEQISAVRKMTMPLAEAQGFVTDDDIFKAVS